MNTKRASWGFDLSAIDHSVDPRDDFFRHANGKWISATEIPDDQTSWGLFTILQDENWMRLKIILEGLTGRDDLADGDERQKLRDFYRTALDMEKRNRDSINCLRPYLKQIAAIETSDDLTEALAHLQLISAKPIWNLEISQNPKDSATVALFLLQGGLGLPDREYYIADDKIVIREKYVAHLQRVLMLLGNDLESATRKAGIVLAIETELARVSWSRSRLRNIASQCNYFTTEGLEDLVSAVNWRNYFEILGVDTSQPVIVGQPGFFSKAQELLKNLSIEDWKAYLTWQLVRETAYHLDETFISETFDFYGKTLSGQRQLKPLWKLAVTTINELMGEALGKLYVERHFGQEAQIKIGELVANVIAAFETRVNNLDWMSPTTKAKAIEKLHIITWKLGCPEHWRDYSKLDIKTDAYLLNVMRAREFNQRWWLSKIGKPVDRGIWLISPQTVNAYAEPGLVEMVFPAGILQWPFFDPLADDAINYGAIGMVISHELTHHFDDEGSTFDKKGNLNNWWMPEDRDAFERLSKGLIEQFSRCKLYEVPIDGKLTLGENIADLSGIAIAFDAYQKSLDGKERYVLDGFTAEQRFFLGYAQVWREKIRKEAALQRLVVDPHSPPEFRVNIPLSNIEEFCRAFGIRRENTMFRLAEERVKIW